MAETPKAAADTNASALNHSNSIVTKPLDSVDSSSKQPDTATEGGGDQTTGRETALEEKSQPVVQTIKPIEKSLDKKKTLIKQPGKVTARNANDSLDKHESSLDR